MARLLATKSGVFIVVQRVVGGRVADVCGGRCGWAGC